MVDVDGNVQSNRFRHVMTQGAIVLKATNTVSAYAASLHALPHMIMVVVFPILSRPCAAAAHDAATLRALHRGTAVASDLLSYESVLGYWADLLHHYAALQTFTPQRLEVAVPAAGSPRGSAGSWGEAVRRRWLILAQVLLLTQRVFDAALLVPSSSCTRAAVTMTPAVTSSRIAFAAAASAAAAARSASGWTAGSTSARASRRQYGRRRRGARRRRRA